MSQLAIIYARFSTSEQRGFSIERQRKLGIDFATQHDWTVEKTITDEGRSAFHGANRYEGASLHEFEIEARNGLHTGKVLVVENIDRLSRQGAKAAAQLIWGLNENGVDVATYHDAHIYRAAASGEMLDIFKLVIIAQQAHEESSKKSKRTTATWQKRRDAISQGAKDIPVPNMPLWVDRIGGKMVLNEQRVKVLNEIYDLYIDGVGIHKIVTILNARDEPSWTPPEQRRGNNGWFYSYVYRLLTKRTVLGEYVTNKGEILAVDFFPQAISAEKWNRAQAALAMRKGNQTTTKANYNRNLLQGIVVCGECGGGAHFRHQIDKGQTYTKKNGEVITYKRNDHRRLRCDRARRKHNCSNGTILSYDVVEATVLNELLPRLVAKRTEAAAVAKLREQLAEIVRLRDADQNRLDNLIGVLEEGGPKAIVQRVAALQQQIEDRRKSIDLAQKALGIEMSKPSTESDAASLRALEADLDSEFDEVRTYARGRANMSLRRLLKRIVITPTDCFRIEPDDFSWWLFDAKGTMIEGSYVLE
jgi:DNA invertase Pin-like site-specific DNA recombinase